MSTTTSQTKSSAPPTKPTPPKAPVAPFTKKTESSAGDSAASTGQEDTLKAIEKLEAEQKAINTNNVARVANSQVTSADEKLTPLVSIKTGGKPLEKFPETPKDIGKLTLVQINDLLTQLEAERTGSEAARRERLRLHIGLKTNPA